jgi:hypothetical protein
MSQKIVTITEDEFEEKFKPVKNHLDDNASWNGTLYETFGEELEFCFELAKKENRVWTIVECDEVEYDEDAPELDEDSEEYQPPCLYIISGFHYVNRQGFIVTENPYEEETEVKIDW